MSVVVAKVGFPKTTSENLISDSWTIITDDQLGFSVQIPKTWYELDLAKLRYFQGRCFSPKSGDNLVKPQFCIEINPWVSPLSMNGFASNDLKAQQEYFSEINSSDIHEVKIDGSIVREIRRKYQFNGYATVELIEATSLQAEGVEPFYTASIYINHPSKGIVRLFISTENNQQYLQLESIVREVSESFKFTK